MNKTTFKTFRVLAVSSNANAFGLHQHILVARSGEAYTALRSRGPWNESLSRGDEVRVPFKDGILSWAGLSFECPTKVSPAPKAMVRRLFSVA